MINWRLVLVGGTTIVLFDAGASLASLAAKFPYQDAAIGSVLIYGALGFIAYGIGGLRLCVVTAVMVGAIDASLGWAVSWAIGPGAPPASQQTVPIIAAGAVVAVAIDLISAIIGAGASRIIRGRFPSQA